MKLHFFGAARTVTGSCYMIENGKSRMLIDCGMRQGQDAETKYGEGEFAFNPADIDAMVLTHSHIDHSGLIPLLVKRGFSGKIFATKATCELCGIMLPDCGHIQEHDADYMNKKRMRQGKDPIEPLYTLDDAIASLKQFTPVDYGDTIELLPGFSARFVDAGHLLGSASIELWAREDGKSTKLTFSGDIGRAARPLISDPQTIDETDYLIIEGTYGDRLHFEPTSKTEELARIIHDTFKRGGNLVIPSFAVGRTQEMLFYINKIIRDKILPDIKRIPVYIDSPLGIEATKIYEQNAREYFDEEAMELLKKGVDPMIFDSLYVARTVDESKAINFNTEPKIIISSSGMCEAGRIQHHLKHNLWREESTILFVGFQAIGTLGRTLLDGKKTIKMFGEEISVNAKLERIEGFSGHADADELTAWAKAFTKRKPQKVFCVHGEGKVLDIFSERLSHELGYETTVPSLFEEYDIELDSLDVSHYAAPVISQPYVSAYAANFKNLLDQSNRVYALLKSLNDQPSDSPLPPDMEVKLKVFYEDLRSFADKWEKLLK